MYEEQRSRGCHSSLVHEAVSMPIERGSMTLKERVDDILGPIPRDPSELSGKALHEIGRCVGWNFR